MDVRRVFDILRALAQEGDALASSVTRGLGWLLGSVRGDATSRSAGEALAFQAQVLHHVHNSIIVTDLDGKIIYWNPAATAMFGYRAEEMLGKTPSILYPTEDPQRLKDDLDRILAGQEFSAEWQGRHRSGRTLWIEIRTRVLQDQTGEPLGFIGVGSDITARKQAERDREALVSKLKGLAAASPAISGSVTVEQVLETITEQARELIGTHIALACLRAGDPSVPSVAARSLSDDFASQYGADAFEQSRLEGAVCALVAGGNAPVRLTQIEIERHPAFSGVARDRRLPRHGCLAVPLIARDGTNIGFVQLADRIAGEFNEHDEAVLVQLAQMASVAIENARLLGSEHHAREDAERAVARAAPLLALTQALARAVGERNTAQAVARLGKETWHADKAALWLLDDEALLLELSARDADDATDLERGLSLAADHPVAAAVRRNQLLAIEGPHPRPEALSVGPALRGALNVVVPIGLGERAIGALVLEFRWRLQFTDDDRELLAAMASQCAISLERARLFAEQEATGEATRFLSDASAELAESFDHESTLKRVADVAVPRVADLCVLDLVSEDGSVFRVHVTAKDPEILALRDQIAALPTDLKPGYPLGDALATGKPVLVSRADDVLPGVALEPRRARMIAVLRVRSLLVIPLSVGPRRIGVLSLVYTDSSGRRYRIRELALAEELGRRAAMAIARAETFQEREALLARERAAYLEADKANRAKDEFLAMLGHELRNPLSPIVTALYLMRERGGDSLLRERTIIERQVQHVVRLVDDLLDISRITRGRVELQKQPIEISTVVSKALEMASPLLEQRGHELELALEPRLIAVVDEGRLIQVLSNLLTNAAKYTERGGRVRVSLRREGDDAVICVRDSGIGMPPHLVPRVFELFTQGERTLDRSEGGLGLGLAIVKSLVELHGGSVRAHSAGVGQGSEFEVRLPLTMRTSEPALPEAERATRASGVQRRGLRVLIVDDNRDAADALADALVHFGCETRVAVDGPEALDAAQRFSPEIAFVDIGLPVMDGYELARRMRELDALHETPLVALTGYGQESDRERSADAGFACHLVKPPDLKRILAVIDELTASA